MKVWSGVNLALPIVSHLLNMIVLKKWGIKMVQFKKSVIFHFKKITFISDVTIITVNPYRKKGNPLDKKSVLMM